MKIFMKLKCSAVKNRTMFLQKLQVIVKTINKC